MDILVIHSLYIPYIFPRYVPCIFPCVFLNIWSQEELRTWRKEEFWSNLACFGSRNSILTKFINDSASFLLGKLKNHIILIKKLNIWPKILRTPKKSKKILKILGSWGFLGTPVALGSPVEPCRKQIKWQWCCSWSLRQPCQGHPLEP